MQHYMYYKHKQQLIFTTMLMLMKCNFLWMIVCHCRPNLSQILLHSLIQLQILWAIICRYVRSCQVATQLACGLKNKKFPTSTAATSGSDMTTWRVCGERYASQLNRCILHLSMHFKAIKKDVRIISICLNHTMKYSRKTR